MWPFTKTRDATPPPPWIFNLTLSQGRVLWVDRLHISGTYETLMVGEPDGEINARILNRIPDTVSRLFEEFLPLHIVDPEIIHSERQEPYWPEGKRKISRMPAFLFIGRFISPDPVKDGHASWLAIAWFQALPVPILEDRIKARMQKIDWDAKAADFEW